MLVQSQPETKVLEDTWRTTALHSTLKGDKLWVPVYMKTQGSSSSYRAGLTEANHIQHEKFNWFPDTCLCFGG